MKAIDIMQNVHLKEKEAARSVTRRRVRLLVRALPWGACSVVLYLLVFLNQGTITEYFTKGGFMAVVVVITALTFSMIHGSFANYMLGFFGIEALKHKEEDH